MAGIKYSTLLSFTLITILFLFSSQSSPGDSEDRCFSHQPWQLSYVCYEKKTLNIIAQQGIEAALAYVNGVVKPSSSLPTVHRLYHIVGHHAYLHTKNLDQALSYLDPYSRNQERFDFPIDGYRHGLMMLYFEDQKKKPIPDLIQGACGKFLDISSLTSVAPKIALAAGQCFHTVGHGLMAMNGNDVVASLPPCDPLPRQWMRNACYYGVFMENAYLYALYYNDTPSRNPQEPRPSVKGKSMKSLCGEFDGWKEYECNRFVGWTLFNHSSNFTDIEDAFEECQTLKTPGAEICINEFSLIFVPPFFKDNFPALITACKKLPKSEYQGACLNGAAVGIKVGAGGTKAQNNPFCELLEDQFRRSCLEALENELKWGRH